MRTANFGWDFNALVAGRCPVPQNATVEKAMSMQKHDWELIQESVTDKIAIAVEGCKHCGETRVSHVEIAQEPNIDLEKIMRGTNKDYCYLGANVGCG